MTKIMSLNREFPAWCVLLAILLFANIGKSSEFKLTVLHTNDVHAHFEQFTGAGAKCAESDAAANKCYGGMARLATKIKEFRNLYNNTILMDAGDQFQGTPWFTMYKGLAASYFMNLLNYTVMTLGNHEFDNKVAMLIPFLENVTFPVVSANIHYPNLTTITSKIFTTNDTEAQRNLWNSLVSRYVVLNVGGEKFGVIGYITTDTLFTSSPAPLKFDDVINSVRSAAVELKSQGVNKLIALGHAGFEMDLQIAREVPDIDIVVGGHSHTFLYTGTPLSSGPEVRVDNYPVVVTHNGTGNGSLPDSGSYVTLVVQDYTIAKYLGFLQVEFDTSGKITNWTGNPILLDYRVQQDSKVAAEIDVWGKKVDSSYSRVIGNTRLFLDGESCRLRECILGNVMADTMVDYFSSDPVAPEPLRNVTVSLLNGGSVRSSILPGNITYADVLTVMPFGNKVLMVDLLGSDITKVLEYSVSGYDVLAQNGKFLQLSGIHVLYDLYKPDGERVVNVSIRTCPSVGTPCPLNSPYQPLNSTGIYRIIISSFLLDGGDGYSIFSDRSLNVLNIGIIDIDIIVSYMQRRSPIQSKIEGRILFLNDSNLQTTTGTGGSGSSRSPGVSGITDYPVSTTSASDTVHTGYSNTLRHSVICCVLLAGKHFKYLF